MAALEASPFFSLAISREVWQQMLDCYNGEWRPGGKVGPEVGF